jgi:hypothetical protein
LLRPAQQLGAGNTQQPETKLTQQGAPIGFPGLFSAWGVAQLDDEGALAADMFDDEGSDGAVALETMRLEAVRTQQLREHIRGAMEGTLPRSIPEDSGKHGGNNIRPAKGPHRAFARFT